jgi:cyclomaltodextrinase / maltogenic alpha-amylase / neopullulanase
LIALRHRYPALRTGTYQVLSALGTDYVFARTLEEETLWVAVNTGMEPTRIELQLGSQQSSSFPTKQLFGTSEFEVYQTDDLSFSLSIQLAARSGCILGQ